MTRIPAAVVLLHGHGRFGASMHWIARRLRREGYATLAPSYRYRRSLADSVASLAPRVERLRASTGAPVHLVGHSLGGLVARGLIGRLPAGVIGRVVMLGTPNGGSEWADLLIRWKMARLLLGPSAAHLRTRRAVADEAILAGNGHEIGVIAGTRALDPILPRLLLPGANDGKVTVEATKMEGMAAHIVLPVSHTLMVYDRGVIDQVLAFLDRGRFIQ